MTSATDTRSAQMGRRSINLHSDKTVVTLEQTVTGAYRPTARFARFKNVPEWLQLFQLAADIRMGSELPELERLKPRLVGGNTPGKRIYRTATATTELLQFMERLAERVQHLGPPVKGADNMLKIASDARKAALDMRLVTPGAPEHPRSKLNLAADEIAAVHQDTEHDRGIQLVFLDLGTPKTRIPKVRGPMREVATSRRPSEQGRCS